MLDTVLPASDEIVEECHHARPQVNAFGENEFPVGECCQECDDGEDKRQVHHRGIRVLRDGEGG